MGIKLDNFNVYGRIFYPNGTAFSSRPWHQSTYNWTQADSFYYKLNKWNAFVVWQGNQAGNWDVYGQHFLSKWNGFSAMNLAVNQVIASDQMYTLCCGLKMGVSSVTWQGRSNWKLWLSMGVFFHKMEQPLQMNSV